MSRRKIPVDDEVELLFGVLCSLVSVVSGAGKKQPFTK